MQKGRSLVELAQEVERQRTTKRDFKVQSDAIELWPGADGGLGMSLGSDSFALRPTFHEHMSEHTKIPKPYYDRMLAEAPDLLAHNANHWLRAKPTRNLVRTLDGAGRGFLSDRFRTIDHSDMLEAVLPALPSGIDVVSSQVTDRRLYLQVTTARLTGEVRVGEVVQGGVSVKNSEIGYGRVIVEGFLYVLRCRNGMVSAEGFKRAHLGRRMEGFAEGVEEYFRDSTQRLSDAALFAQLRDTVAGLLTDESFTRSLAPLREAAGVRIEADPVKVVEVTTKRLGMNDTERSSVLRHLVEGGDLTKWGLANAVTRLAHDVESYDRAVEIEQFGSRIVELPKSEWQEIERMAA